MLIPVILSGGAGTRLWPVSRESFPKPFMRLGGPYSLLQRTLQRAAAACPSAPIGIVTNREYVFKTADEAQGAFDAEHRPEVVQLLEPFGRNTAPAVALAALWAQAIGGDAATLLVLPADHLIQRTDDFVRDAHTAEALAADGRLVTFGIRPTQPETGFGYIELGTRIGGSCDSAPGLRCGHRVARFVEKPDLPRALEFLQSGRFLWNSGMFCFRADAILAAFERHAPEVLAAARRVWEQSRQGKARIEFASGAFNALPDISIDYAVMEKAAGAEDRHEERSGADHVRHASGPSDPSHAAHAKHAGRTDGADRAGDGHEDGDAAGARQSVAVLEASFDWSDIGSWKAVSTLFEPDRDGNTKVGSAVIIDSRNTHVQSEDRLIAAVGLENLLVIDTADAVLVAHKERSQDVKAVVARLKAEGHEAFRLHRTVARPWGTYTVLMEGPRFKIKRIAVKPGASLSLQMHHHRSEHWVVVSGTARVLNDTDELLVSANQSTYIPIGARHRLENPGVVDLVMIEVQCGDYLGEDDIVRFDDIYGRTQKAGSEGGPPNQHGT